LLNYGADINIQDKEDGWTPLMVAAYNGHVDLVRFLLKNGANPRLRSLEDKTAYDWALEAKKTNTEIQSMLQNAMKAPPSLQSLARRSLWKTGKMEELPEYLQ